jgi:hypothetical protein
MRLQRARPVPLKMINERITGGRPRTSGCDAPHRPLLVPAVSPPRPGGLRGYHALLPAGGVVKGRIGRPPEPPRVPFLALLMDGRLH